MTTDTATGTTVVRFETRALGTGVELVLTDAAVLARARELLLDELDAVDRLASRFRHDSELATLNRNAGTPVDVSPAMASLLKVALRAAVLSGGRVDPTVGAAVVATGYDMDFAELARRAGRGVGAAPASGEVATDRHDPTAFPVPGYRVIDFDEEWSQVTVPSGVLLDLDATAKSAAADRIAGVIAGRLGCGTMLSIGGDVAVAGTAPAGGFRVGVADVSGGDNPDTVVAIESGGLATSGTAARAWVRDGSPFHHLIDPRTGRPARTPWRTASVAAGTCVDANTAATAAVLIGGGAEGWLARLRLPGRLVATDGSVTTVAGWPEEPRGTGGDRATDPDLAAGADRSPAWR